MPEVVKNIGIVAHVDAGKTTLTEQLLYGAGEVRQAGSVDHGTAVTDWLDIERSRGISVRTSIAVLQHNGQRINLIDTPGHADFSGEVERCLSILDAVVLVVSAAEGIQAQTEALWEALRRLEIPTLLFINKIDRAGCEPGRILQEVQQHFSENCLAFSGFENHGSRDCAIRLYGERDEDFCEELKLNAAMAEERFEASYENGTLSYIQALDSFRRRFETGQAYPVYFGAASRGVGSLELLDAICDWAPSSSGREEDALSGIVYKLEHDATMGKACFVRLFSGVLKNRDTVMLEGQEQPQKITQIRRVSGNKTTDTGSLKAGDVAAVYGLSNAKVGSVLGNKPSKKEYQLAQPLYRVQVTPAQEADWTKLRHALGELAEEDPGLGLEWQKEERELTLQVTGTIQLEVLEELLRERYGVESSFSPPTVIYKETPAQEGYGFEAYTMPKPCWAVIKLLFTPAKRGSGLTFSSQVADEKMFKRYQHHVETSVADSLKQGLYGWEVTDLHVTLVDGEHHIEHTHPLDFFVATPMAVINGLENCGTTLLEPMVLLRITAAEDLLGKVIGDLIAMRGTFGDPVIRKGQFTLEARVPAATSMDYSVRLGILSSGTGTLSSRFDGYEPCPLEQGATTPRRGIDPRDRAKWILHARNAL